MEKLKNYLELTVYTKGGASVYCDFYFYNGKTYEKGTTKASGYGYDKHSTALSNAINKYMYLYKLKNGVKWESKTSGHSTLKNRTYYGLYNMDGYLFIDYGIGESSVLNCLGLFSNVKVLERYYGKNEDFYKLEITTTSEQLQKKLEKNQKELAKLEKKEKNDYTKHEKKRLQAEQAEILNALKWEA